MKSNNKMSGFIYLYYYLFVYSVLVEGQRRTQYANLTCLISERLTSALSAPVSSLSKATVNTSIIKQRPVSVSSH